MVLKCGFLLAKTTQKSGVLSVSILPRNSEMAGGPAWTSTTSSEDARLGGKQAGS